MSVDRRKRGIAWAVTNEDGQLWDRKNGAHLAVLMDIRDQLTRLNAILDCPNFIGIPRTLKGIQRKLPTPDRGRKGQS